MAVIDYIQRLDNIQARKFDSSINESLISKSFSRTDIPADIKYLREITTPLGRLYNNKTIDAGSRVKNHLKNGLDLHLSIAYRNQGSVMTDTNIKVHSDFDLLTIIDRYHYTGEGVPNNNPYTETNPISDIELLREQTIDILKKQYDEIDLSGSKSISIFNKNLKRKVDVVFCYWYNTVKYESSRDEYYRGVYLFDFDKNEKILDYPFAHIQSVNTKGVYTNGGSKKAIRMLKNIKADSNNELTSFQLTSIVHSIDNNLLPASLGDELSLAQQVSFELSALINNNGYRKSVKSPNGTEYPLIGENCIEQLINLKDELDTLIRDVKSNLKYSYNYNSLINY